MYHIYSLLSPIFIGTQNKLYIILSVENCKNLRKNKKIYKILEKINMIWNRTKKIGKTLFYKKAELSTKMIYYKNIVESSTKKEAKNE